MNEIVVTYRAAGAQSVIRIDGDKHDIAEVLEACRRRIFPGVAADETPVPPRPEPAKEVSPQTRADYKAGVRDTSREALHKHQASGKLGRQEMVVYGYVRGHNGEDFTRQEIARGLDMGINAVCGLVHALINDHGILRETRKRTCRVTGETVMAIGAI